MVVWNDTLVDGHNRYKICRKHGIEFKTVDKLFDNRTQAKIWIICNQFARRNLAIYERCELALALEPLIAAEAKGNQGTRTDILMNSSKSIKPINTRKELAQKASVGEDTIAKANDVFADV